MKPAAVILLAVAVYVAAVVTVVRAAGRTVMG